MITMDQEADTNALKIQPMGENAGLFRSCLSGAKRMTPLLSSWDLFSPFKDMNHRLIKKNRKWLVIPSCWR
jgi:hypothetical protein